MHLLGPYGSFASQGLAEGERVTLVTAMEEDRRRVATGLKVVAYDLLDGCVAGYFPELNPLVPLSLRDWLPDTRASKAIPVRIET